MCNLILTQLKEILRRDNIILKSYSKSYFYGPLYSFINCPSHTLGILASSHSLHWHTCSHRGGSLEAGEVHPVGVEGAVQL